MVNTSLGKIYIITYYIILFYTQYTDYITFTVILICKIYVLSIIIFGY